MLTQQKIIDAHAMLGSEYHLELGSDELLRRMDAAGVDVAIARPMGAELAVDNTQGNDRVLGAHPRIKALVTVNPWFGERALIELERCADKGGVGLFLHPTRQGFMPTDPIVRPLVEFSAARRWPVVFHTGSYVHSDILALAEVARAYPQVAFIAGFGGYTDMWFELPGVMQDVTNIYLDTSMIWSEAVVEVVKAQGSGRVLYGSAEPRNRYATGLKALLRQEFTPDQTRAILYDNARRLFQL